MGEWISTNELRQTVAAALGCAAGDIADDDDLIQLGLNSIRIIALAGGWRKQGADITFAQLAAEPTVGAWHGLLSAAEPAGAAAQVIQTDPTGCATSDDAPFPLAPMQHAYWIGRSAEQELGGVAAHLYVEFDGGPVDPGRLERAVVDLVAAHAMLRTRFLPDGTQQRLPAPKGPVFAVVDLRGQPRKAVEPTLARLRDTKTHQCLHVEDGQVIDVTLTRYHEDSQERSRLHLDVDMLAADAMSYRVLVADLADLYRGATLPQCGYSYRQYRIERHDDDAARERGRRWWQRRLPELPGGPQLPVVAANDRAAQRSVRYQHRLGPRARKRLITSAHSHAVTPAMAVAAIFADTVGGWSAQSRFLLNVPLFQRESMHPDIDRVVGDFTSSVMLEVDVTETASVADRARDIQRRMYDSAAHAAYCGLDVLRDLGRHRGEQALAPVVFTSALDLGELFADNVIGAFGEPVWIISQAPQVLLDAQVTELRGGLLLNWDVRESAFPPGLIDAMFARFTSAVERLAEGDSGWEAQAAVQLPVGQALTRAAVNATDGPVSGRRLHQGFFDNAAANPDAQAMVWGVGERAGVCSYGELAERSLAVAGALRDHGVGRGDAVAVQLPSGPDQVLAVLGVLAAGAAYVPIGVGEPDARRATMLQTADVAAVLVQEDPGTSGQIPRLSIDAARRHPAPLPAPVLGDTSDIAYVIFTSGSTGLPKGVEVSHRAAMNTVDAVNEWFDVGSSDRALALSALEFDLSVYDIFGMLSAGGSLVAVEPQQRAAPGTWVELLGRHRVSILNCVPSILEMILDAGAGQLPASLRAVILGGDWVGAELARRLAEQAPGCRFAGLGGATETAIHATICEVDGEPPPHWATVPFGVPLRNMRCRIVAPSGRDCPDWVPGELWVGGPGVAAGYRNDPARTAQRFVEHDGMRWYITGDMARYVPDGSIEFLGRADNQVQIRGYRVELGEVENALRALPGVRQAVAAVTGSGAPTLVAAISGHPDELGSGDAVIAAAADRLPSYMVPTRIVFLDRIPLTPNAKLDRRTVAALLEAQAHHAADTERSAPRNEVEAALAVIVAEVLGMPGQDSVGVHRDFLAMGGDSVLATKVIALVRDWLETEHGVVEDVFATRTVAGLAERLQQRDAQRGTPDRLAAVARIYLEVAAMTDEEVLAQG